MILILCASNLLFKSRKLVYFWNVYLPLCDKKEEKKIRIFRCLKKKEDMYPVVQKKRKKKHFFSSWFT